VAPLVTHFVAELRPRLGSRARGFAPEALRLLGRYRFPGNVRELRNVIERCLIFAEGEEVQASDLPPEVLGTSASAATAGPIVSLEQLEREHIARALAATGGNKTRVAQLLGIDRTTLYAKIQRYELAP
jgi:DNA-binding NtrC family response regulator